MNVDECERASMGDVVQMRADYYAHVDNTRTQQRARSMLVGEADENKMDENERAMYQLAQKQCRLRDMVRKGQMSLSKYLAWKGKVSSGRTVTDEDEEADRAGWATTDSDTDSGDDEDAATVETAVNTAAARASRRQQKADEAARSAATAAATAAASNGNGNGNLSDGDGGGEARPLAIHRSTKKQKTTKKQPQRRSGRVN